jgi:hypothetical protein
MTPDLHETLVRVGAAMAPARDPWWIIAGAAAALHGAPIEPADVDLLASERDARALLTKLGVVATPSPSDRFRSALFARWSDPPLPVDIMAGFHVRHADDWRPLLPATRVSLILGDTTLYLPSIPDLIAQCTLYGRPKDAERATLLQRLGTD